MTAPYAHPDDVAANALQIACDLRTQSTSDMYEGLVREAYHFPGRVAQIVMCLAAWTPVEEGPDRLGDRAQAVADQRVHDMERSAPWVA